MPRPWTWAYSTSACTNVGFLDASNKERKKRNKISSMELTRDIEVPRDTLGSREGTEGFGIFGENLIMTRCRQNWSNGENLLKSVRALRKKSRKARFVTLELGVEVVGDFSSANVASGPKSPRHI